MNETYTFSFETWKFGSTGFVQKNFCVIVLITIFSAYHALLSSDVLLLLACGYVSIQSPI